MRQPAFLCRTIHPKELKLFLKKEPNQSGLNKAPTLEGRGIDLPLEGAVEFKAQRACPASCQGVAWKRRLKPQAKKEEEKKRIHAYRRSRYAGKDVILKIE